MSNPSGQGKCHVAWTGQPLVDAIFSGGIEFNSCPNIQDNPLSKPSGQGMCYVAWTGQPLVDAIFSGGNLIHVQISRTVQRPSQVAKACAMLLGKDSHW